MAADPRTTSSPNSTATDGIVCPFCAHVRGGDAGGACPKCTMEDTVGTRRSTGERIGPWFVLQRKNPTAPGLRFSVLLTLARRGHVTGKSIVRGPTTGQLWRFAAEVKGLSRLFGVCWHCRADVSPDATTCPRCKSAQEIPDDPDVFLESHSTLPVMRDLPALADAPPASEERLPAKARRDRVPDRVLERVPERAVELKPAVEFKPEAGSFDNLDDLTRALTLHRATEPASPARRGNARAASETILSASDLAAAFQLDAPRAGIVARTRHVLWTLTKVAVVLAIVLGLLGTAVALVKPQWRLAAQERARPFAVRASTLWDQAYTAIAGPSTSIEKRDAIVANAASDGSASDRNKNDEAGDVPPTTPIHSDEAIASASASPTKVTEPKSVSITPAPRVIKSTPPSVVDATPGGDVTLDGLSGQQSTATPTTRAAPPKRLKTTPIEPTVANAEPLEPKVEPKSEPKVEPKAEPPARDAAKPPTRESEVAAKQNPAPPEPTKPAPLTLDEAIAQATELRNSALDAEARHDWKAAIVIYEQIATLPEAARPSDLKVRLALARERLEADSRQR